MVVRLRYLSAARARVVWAGARLAEPPSAQVEARSARVLSVGAQLAAARRFVLSLSKGLVVLRLL